MDIRKIISWIVNLLSDNESSSKTLLKSERLKRTWLRFALFLFIALFGLFAIFVISTNLLIAYLNVGNAVLTVRVINLVYALMFILGIGHQNYKYYKIVVEPGKEIRLKHIVILYSLVTFSFSFFYLSLYIFMPRLFLYTDTIVASEPLRIFSKFMSCESPIFPFINRVLDFFLFSLLNSASLDYYLVKVNSRFISFILYIQSIYSLFLVGVLLSSHIEQQANK